MRRSPRTRFAAPFVIVVSAAGGCSDGKKGGGTAPPDPHAPRQTWGVHRTPEGCEAILEIRCPPPEEATCNPPAPMFMRCPPEAPEGGFKVVSFDGTSCFLEGGQVAVTCPSYDPPPPPSPPDAAVVAAARRRWEIQRGKAACFAVDDPCSRLNLAPGDPIPPCNPPEPIKIECPPETVRAIVETAPDTCETENGADCPPDAKCNPPAPFPTPCPHY